MQAPTFDGATYSEARDGDRLRAQHSRVFAVMKDGAWRSLHAIAAITNDPEASISARLRDLRKPRFGGHGVERKFAGDGLWLYRLVLADRELFE